jgi:lysophospholipase L1-like esterase
MVACMVLGDSLAVGVSRARPECQVVAVSGITSARFLQTWVGPGSARDVVISLGANDGDSIDTLANLRRLRAAVRARTVYWLLPGHSAQARAAIRSVAALFRDRLIDTAPLAGPDGLHPTRAGYAELAQQTQAVDAGVQPGSAYQDFAPRGDAYRAFPGVTVWNGPYNANGRYVQGAGQGAGGH